MASSSVNDPSQGNNYQEDFSCSESNSESSATEEESDRDEAEPRVGLTPCTSAKFQQDQKEPCRYYNSGHCRDGKRCHYLHVCKYALRGKCCYGDKCRLKHPSSFSDRDGGGGRRERRRSSSGSRGGGGRRDRRRSSSGGRGGGGRRDRRSSLSGGRGGGGRRDRRRSLSGGRGGGGRRDRRMSLSGGRGGGGRRDRRRSLSGGRGGGGRRDRRRSLSGGSGGGGRRDRRSLSGGRGGGGRRDRRRSLSGGSGGGGRRDRRRSLSGGSGGGGRRDKRRSSSGGRGGGGGSRDRRRSLSGGSGGGGRRDRRRSLSGGSGGGGRRDKRRSSSGGRGGGGGSRDRRRSSSGGRGGGGGRRDRRRSSSGGAQHDFSGPYKWQLEDGHGWKDIANDHILEAQYSQPNNKGINIYNTPYGAVSIDFKAMRVRGKNLRVRRLDGQQTVWIWFYSTRKGWIKYGEKDSKGNPGPIQSSEIEKKFQRNRNGSLTFNIGSETFEVRFRQMRQVSGKRKRKVVRRPKYQPPQSGNLIGRVTSAFQKVRMSSAGQSESPEWQFGGKSGRWHSFKDSADIEDKYQQDSNGFMSFTVNGQAYKLDFSAMKQTNQSTRVTRNIRRVK